MTNVTLIGLDTAKNIFHLHAVNQNGKQVYQRKLRRRELLTFLAQAPVCTVGMEACTGSHHWAREFKKLGHTVKIINARRVKQFASRNKNDFNDARAITKAARDDDTYLVSQKSIEQQSIQAIHTLRDARIKHRTATVNATRALLVEFGLIVPQGRAKFMKALPDILENPDNDLSAIVRELLSEQYHLLQDQNEQIKKYNRKLDLCLKSSEQAQALSKIPGVGKVISTALVYMIADPKNYKNGRNCAAYLGLTPKEHSTGGKQKLGRISREGNAYLRKIIVQGAQSLLRVAHKKEDALSQWASHMKQAKGTNLAAIALANKIVRIAWAMLVKSESFNYQPSVQSN